jgi:uncharacterized membrane protein
MVKSSSAKTRRLVGMAIFTAIIVVLQLAATFVKIGTFSITLTLVPIVVGSAVYGPKSGAYFGGVFGVVTIIAFIFGWDVGGNVLWNANPFLTVFLCLLKAVMAGWCAGLVYSLLAKKNLYAGVISAAIVCPIVNTGIFCIAMPVFFYKVLVSWAGGSSILYFTIAVLIGVNFLVELGLNIILGPTVHRIIKAERIIH